MPEADYIRASSRVIGILEDEKMMREIAMAGDREQKLGDFIDERFENNANLKRAVLYKLDNKFTQNIDRRFWRGRTLNNVFDEYKIQVDEIQREAREKEERDTQIKMERYDREEKGIKTRFEGRKKEAISRMERQLIERNEKSEIIAAQRRLSGAERIKLEQEGRLIK